MSCCYLVTLMAAAAAIYADPDEAVGGLSPLQGQPMRKETVSTGLREPPFGAVSLSNSIRKGFGRELTLRFPRIGTDEAGKGDYFGYLVIAGVMLRDPLEEEELRQAGVTDSKKLTDARIMRLADLIQSRCLYDVVMISPEKYNQLYERFANLNKLLAWGHARVIENLLAKEPCDYAISDQFGDQRYILNSLQKRGREITVEQRHRAESDLAVAAASIIARAAFVRTLSSLSRQVGIELPKGATHIIEPGKRLVAEKGAEILGKVAKLHFRSTDKILGR